MPKLIHISTDEVYGDIKKSLRSDENHRYVFVEKARIRTKTKYGDNKFCGKITLGMAVPSFEMVCTSERAAIMGGGGTWIAMFLSCSFDLQGPGPGRSAEYMISRFAQSTFKWTFLRDLPCSCIVGWKNIDFQMRN